ncbi:5'-3' exonuclease PLD3-like isoform X1 [Rhincodon typus]|uniref:5'-3' exonuclease PLD3-like isoform X1 n=1 Tax=Rhincodon typus TaxID=259920 RepID=UPI00202DBA7A|nr:5'-3' exonuclease PLD3-like isoform X1 [Rhincodon typus]
MLFSKPMKPLRNLEHQISHTPYIKSRKKCRHKWWKGPVVFVLLMTVCLATFALIQSVRKLIDDLPDKEKAWKQLQSTTCDDPCRFVVVESVPDGVVYGENATKYQLTYNSWLNLITIANSSLDIASFYWTLTGHDINVTDPSSKPGEILLRELGKLPLKNVSVRIASSTLSFPHQLSTDLKILKEKGIHVRKVNFQKLLSGVLHTKLWIVDKKHIYIGSANMDWRALTQVKELGAVIYNCSCLANDFSKIFEAYWSLGLPNATIPSPWPPFYSTNFNKDTPLEVKLNGTAAKIYFSSSPPKICPKGRTTDLDAILSGINAAKKFLYISVMEYFPTSRFLQHVLYWPHIDDSLRKAAIERHVHVQMLVGYWKHTDKSMLAYLQSLQALRNIRKVHFDVKLFVVPVGKFSNIPYARVCHTKYFVTENIAYIGTSNWSFDYFNSTTGVGLLINQTSEEAGDTAHHQLKNLFQRDWNSNYSVTLDDLKDKSGFPFKMNGLE